MAAGGSAPPNRSSLKREISGRGLVEAFLTIIMLSAIAGTILDRQARSGDAIAAAVLAIVLLIGRINPYRTAAWREKRERRHASRPRRVYTARKRRAVGIVMVMVVYLMIRPDRHGSLAVVLAYSLVFCGVILVVLNVRKQHLIGFFRHLTGRPRSKPTGGTDASGFSSGDT